ncbi:MAG: isocitrate lyase/phosphoenolpyruvate mutase family protein, partial [Ignavibacteria bacterium]|nr:isocitrate lyase/phosphoenolpyruvate mutase family protein [Ignavibacteria bacterium]
MESFEKEIVETEQWFSSPRFQGITRLYSPRQVVEQRGTIRRDYSVARNAAEGFFDRLRELFSNRQQITTFGPYSPGQAVIMKRMGLEGIYLGGWATSAKGSVTEDQGPDLASYPLSQVPDDAAGLVRALLSADKNQQFARSRMSEKERMASPVIDYRPFIIADADTGHGGEAHVRNLIRRFVEAGVPGYHIEDQKPGVKKCGHQAGKVLVPQYEQNIRLNAARFQLDIMKVPGIIVARTDAEAATFLDGRGDERDHPFILGATNIDLPSYKVAYLAVLKRFYDKGAVDVNGHLLYKISDTAYDEAFSWLDQVGVMSYIDEKIQALKESKVSNI